MTKAELKRILQLYSKISRGILERKDKVVSSHYGRKHIIQIPIRNILTVSIHDGDGSFDISVTTPTQKFSMHCFIKEQRKKKDEIVFLLKSKGIRVKTNSYMRHIH